MTNKKLTNLEQIKQAYAWNYGAIYVLKNPPLGFSKQQGVIVSIYPNGRLCMRCDNGVTQSITGKMEGDEIIGYKYLGELGGNEPIPFGTIFKVKKILWNKELVDKLVEFRGYGGVGTRLQAVYGGRDYQFEKHEIEPVFN